jgi:hypothetical protein
VTLSIYMKGERDVKYIHDVFYLTLAENMMYFTWCQL